LTIRGESTILSVSIVTQETAESAPLQEESDKRTSSNTPISGTGLTIETKNLLWRMSTRRFDTSRPEWIYGQLTITSEAPYRVINTIQSIIT
jgi:hypothetical protein